MYLPRVKLTVTDCQSLWLVKELWLPPKLEIGELLFSRSCIFSGVIRSACFMQ